MSAFAIDTGATLQCAHAAPVRIAPGSARVRLGGVAASTLADQYTVTGCPFTTGGNPLPCTTIQWVTQSTRVRASGQPLILSSSTGLCISSAPQGAPTVVTQQMRVRAT